MERKNLIGLTAPEIFEIIQNEDFKYRHALAVAHSLYKRKSTDLSLYSKIPKKLVTYLKLSTETVIYEPVTSQISYDKTIKYLFRNREGKQFETVFIPDGKRNTVCVSVQSGCRMGCPFCVTAGYGYHGNLATEDIVNQVLAMPLPASVTHIVFMGMGEPMDNIFSVLKACEIFTAEWGMALSPGNITVSTVGMLDPVHRFLRESDCNLTISLFSPFPEERLSFIPAEKKYPVLEIIDIMKKYPLKKKRRLSAAYVMIKGLNDTDRHLDGLIKLLKGTGIRVNLLPFHSSVKDSDISSDAERMHFFKHNLVIAGISASVRKSRGTDISAACGLLASGLKHDL
jgi:23S rRNA (adenine2503-C2)-methyltransferase